MSVVCHAASESISVKGVSGRGIPRVSGAGGRRACGKGQGLQSRTFCKCNAKPRTILARINEWKLGWIWTHDLLAQPVKFISSHHYTLEHTCSMTDGPLLCRTFDRGALRAWQQYCYFRSVVVNCMCYACEYWTRAVATQNDDWRLIDFATKAA